MGGRFVSLAVCVATLVTNAVLAADTVKLDFEADAIGTSPKQFSFALTGQGKPGVWIVKKDDPAHGNVLAQTNADPTDYRFPVAIYNGITATDLDLAVEFKTITGNVDQGAGLVWRYRIRITTTSLAATRSRTTAPSTMWSTAGVERS